MERWAEVKAQVGTVCVPDESGRESMQVYLALKEMIQEQGLAAVAIGCYPHLMGKVCLAASLLGEQGVAGWLRRGYQWHARDAPPDASHRRAGAQYRRAGPYPRAQQPGPVALRIWRRSRWLVGPERITLGPVRLMNRGLCCLFHRASRPLYIGEPGAHYGRLSHGCALRRSDRDHDGLPGQSAGSAFRVRLPGYLGLDHRSGTGTSLDGHLRRSATPLADFTSMVGCEMLSMA